MTEYSISIGKGLFHFSSAHFVIGKNYVEGIHGHNFIVEIELFTTNLNRQHMVIDFTEIRALTEQILSGIDHKTIIPKNSPWLTIKDIPDENAWEFIGHKRYRLPKTDVVLLPITNGTVEELAEHILNELKPLVISSSTANPFKGRMTVKVNEYEYQSATATTIFE